MSNGHMARNAENSLLVIQKKKKVNTHISRGHVVQERAATQVFSFLGV